MLQAENGIDNQGNPTGGYVTALGLEIAWQDAPLGRGPDRKEPNGCFVEMVIEAAMTRLKFYQESKFVCEETAQALAHLSEALNCLDRRTHNREARGVEGTLGL